MSTKIGVTVEGSVSVHSPSCSTTEITEKPSCSTSTPTGTGGTEAKSSPTILRIKRRINEDPAQALLLSYKRFKGDTGSPVSAKTPEEPDEGVVSHVLRFAGTVTSNDNESDVITQALTAASKEKPLPCKTHNFKHRVANPQEKTRANFHSTISANRFRLVNSKRESAGLKDRESTEGESNSEGPLEFCQIFDAVVDGYKDVPKKRDRENRDPRELGATTCNGVPLIKEKILPGSGDQAFEDFGENVEFDFVYDLYFTQGGISDAFEDQTFSIAGMSEGDLQLADYRQTLEEFESDPLGFGDVEGEEDSNDEGNWRNDYPDSDPDESKIDNSYYGTGEVDELGSHIGRLDVGESSSDADDDYYTPSYRAYKKRVLQEVEPEYSNEVVSLSEDSE